jgi:DNA replication protein DnaC
MQYTTEIIKASHLTDPVVTPTADQVQCVVNAMNGCGIQIYPQTAPAYYAVARQIAFNTLNRQHAKGICLAGPVGTGKTLLMKFISAYTRTPLFSIRKLALLWMQLPSTIFDDLQELLGNNSVIIDDVGSEPTAKQFGNEFPMEIILDERSTWFDDFRVLTHLTTNFRNEDELAERYGDTGRSRILGMCTFISLTGEDWRRK